MIPTLSFSGGTLLLKGLPSRGVRQVFGELPWIWDDRVSGWRTDAIEYPTVRGMIEARRLACDDSVAAWQTVKWPQVDMPILRPEQAPL